MDTKALIDKIIYGLLAAGSSIMIKYISEINQHVQDISIQLSRQSLQVEYHDGQIKRLTDSVPVLFRVETELGMYEKRLNKLEKGE
jgi:hypothetical protein